MSEHPILFSSPMIRALLEGRKTQTRRIIPDDWWRCLDPDDPEDRARAVAMCPYGVPGDRLWTREAWRTSEQLDGYNATQIADRALAAGYKAPWAPLLYECDGVRVNWNAQDWGAPGRLRSSRFMPRWAARLLLELTGVRVQRLQEISLDDARAEGATRRDGEHGGGWSLDWSRVGEPSQWAADRKTLSVQDVCLGSPQMAFGNAWNAINGKRAPWASNPFVWCLTFKVIGDER